jgi:uncharacterized protein
MEEKKHFFLKLNPPRDSFTVDMTPEERSIMQAHVQYWMPYVQNGTIVVFGPVADPKGGYGIMVIEAADKSRVEELATKDPASSICSFEIHPMRAITRNPA